MYSKLPNLILAFHGCDMTTYEKVILNKQALRPSKNDYDWLGNGIYFWESNKQRAYDWATEQVARGKCRNPAVIGAVIDLGYCLNLTDSAYAPALSVAYNVLKSRLENEGKELPSNTGGKDKLLRKLDCAVIEQLHKMNDAAKSKAFDSVRGVFIEGSEIYKGSGFKQKTHIQICVRNPNCIKGYFNPLSEDENYSLP